MEALYILGIGELVLLAISYKLSRKDILNPSTTFSIVFVFSIFVAISYHRNWTSVSSYNWEATVIILSGTLLFIFVDFLVASSTKRRCPYLNRGEELIRVSDAKLNAIILFDIAIIVLFYHFESSIVSKYNAINAYGVDSVGAAYRALYGHDTVVSAEDTMSPIIRYGIYVLQMSAYVCLYPFVNNVLVKKERIRNNYKFIIPAGLFVLYAVMCGTRADMIKIFISGFIMFYILYMKDNGWEIKNIKKIIKKGIEFAVVVFVAFFILSILVGRSALGNTLFHSFVQQIAGYAGASIVHFSQYMDNPVKSSLSGEECFTRLYTFLKNHGIINAEIGTGHLEYRSLVGGMTGNIYTFFRRPLSDFGIAGMYVFVALSAVFISYFYNRKIKYANYSRKNRFGFNLVLYSMLFQAVAYASIEQIFGGFVSVAFLIQLVFMKALYVFLFELNIKTMKIIIH